MARPLRIEYPNAFYHITSRGNAREAIFSDEQDNQLFLSYLKEYLQRHNVVCYGWCLMTNHYHLLIETIEPNLSVFMRQLNGVYTQAFNRRYRRVGHLMQGRYKAILVDKDSYFLELVRYIILNPVRAKMVRSAGEYKWSSYADIIGINKKNIVDRKFILKQFARNNKEAEKEFIKFIKAGIGKDKNMKEEIKGSLFLGSGDFINKVKKFMKKKDIKDINIKKEQRYAGRPQLIEIFSKAKNRKERDKKIIDSHIKYGYNLSEIGRCLGVHCSTIGRAIKNAKCKT